MPRPTGLGQGSPGQPAGRSWGRLESRAGRPTYQVGWTGLWAPPPLPSHVAPPHRSPRSVARAYPNSSSPLPLGISRSRSFHPFLTRSTMTLAYPSWIVMPWIVPPWTGTSTILWATTLSFFLSWYRRLQGSSWWCRPQGNVPQPFRLDLWLGVLWKRCCYDVAAGCCCWLAAIAPSIEATRSSRARTFSSCSAFFLARLR